MIEKNKQHLSYWSSTKDDLAKELGVDSLKDATAQQLFTLLVGDRDYSGDSDYTLYKYTDKGTRTIFHRLNMLWVYPLFFLQAPIQYIITGSIGYNRHKGIGKVMDYLISFKE